MNKQWFGSVPTHWESIPLKYLFQFTGGGTPSRSQSAYWDGDIPWVSPKDMKSSEIKDSEEYITQKGLEDSSSSLVPEGSLLIVARSGILKRTIPVAIASQPVAINQDLRALIPTRDDFDVRFIRLFIRGYRDTLLNLWRSKGATVESLDSNEIAATPFPLPPLETQKEIIDFVDHHGSHIDVLIEKKEHMVEKLKEKREAMVTKSVTKGIDSNTEMKETEVEWIGSVPSHWERLRIGSLIEEVKHPVEVSDDEVYQEIGIRSHGKGIFHKDPVTGEEIGNKNVFEVVEKALIFNIVFAWEGAVAVSTEAENEMIASHRFPMYVPRNEEISLEYLKYFFTHGYGQGVLDWNSPGAAGRNRTLNREAMLSEEFWFPPADEQQRIAQHISDNLSKINSLINTIEQGIHLLKEKRQTFVKRAITGRTDLSDWDVSEEMESLV
ncbi:restriction endonuclease subunit S [Natrarchaeobaculum aegyptiacum]|uniref:Type I restriction modification DNA specificity domain-containing protein n=1 Tax=Natrarchaeobaculum aegyptiacum TaxID=745377 RepID=A0A2Z2HZV2_9EURY|nr:restriction endonuclease subunit S [Natrarchaeobaculum aegyptiacum]ARS89328.1 hypothetical protein B1756_05920 [Natrarchaeobaculum aegyptiacum]